MKWTSLPYRPTTLEDDGIRFTDNRHCQARQHDLEGIPASYLEIVHEENDTMTVSLAWFACSGCHAALEATEFGKDISEGRL